MADETTNRALEVNVDQNPAYQALFRSWVLAERQISQMDRTSQYWYYASVRSGLYDLQRIWDIDGLFSEYQQVSRSPFHQKPMWIQISCDTGLFQLDTSLVEGSTYLRRLAQIIASNRQQGGGSDQRDRRGW